MSSPGGPSKKRTGRACTFCKSRKQKCGGYTAEIKCSACQQRKVRCSFEDEANDPRYNPYLRYEQAARRANSSGLDGQRPVPQPASSTFPGISDQITPRVEAPEWFTPGQMSSAGLSRQYSASSAPQIPATSPTLSFAPAPKATPPQNITGAGVLSQGPAASPTTSSPFPSDFRGPLRTLQPLVHDDVRAVEDVDPVQRHVLTVGEVTVLFQIFFKHCHPHAPFLDVQELSDWRKCRASSALLFLGILQVAARFWGHSSRSDSWVHPRYKELVALLDIEMTRLTLRPHDGDASLATLQGLLLYAHWMPLDIDGNGRVRCRFSETGAWQSLGLAIRWAQQLEMDGIADALKESPDPQRVQEFRTFAYLTESDHYLALSSRRRPTLDPRSLVMGSEAFLNSPGTQSTDLRVVSLLRVAHAASIILRGVGTGAVGVESVKAFDADVVEVERDYLEAASRSGASQDSHARQFPFTSLRWYRLAFASVLLTSASHWSAIGETFHMAVNWASQILFFLSGNPNHTGSMVGENAQTLIPEPALVEFLTFAIDHYYVVISYSAAFLCVAWRQGAIDEQLEISSEMAFRPSRSVSRQSLLYRLVDLAANALSACASKRDHLAIRYAHFIRGLADTLLQELPEANVNGLSTPSNALDSTDWDISYLWQQAGLDPGFLSLSAADLADIGNDQDLFPMGNPPVTDGASNGMWESLGQSATNREQDLPIDYGSTGM